MEGKYTVVYVIISILNGYKRVEGTHRTMEGAKDRTEELRKDPRLYNHNIWIEEHILRD